MQQENLGIYILTVSKAHTTLHQDTHQQYRYSSTKDYRKGKSYSSYDRHGQEDRPSSFRNRDSQDKPQFYKKVSFTDERKEYKPREERRDFKPHEDRRDFKPHNERNYKKDGRRYTYVLVSEDESEGSSPPRSSNSRHSSNNEAEDSSTKAVNFVTDDRDCPQYQKTFHTSAARKAHDQSKYLEVLEHIHYVVTDEERRTCSSCRTAFPSRNLLFQHLKKGCSPAQGVETNVSSVNVVFDEVDVIEEIPPEPKESMALGGYMHLKFAV